MTTLPDIENMIRFTHLSILISIMLTLNALLLSNLAAHARLSSPRARSMTYEGLTVVRADLLPLLLPPATSHPSVLQAAFPQGIILPINGDRVDANNPLSGGSSG